MRIVALTALVAFSLCGEYAALPDGARVWYSVTGKGSPAIVLVHGWTGNTGIWDANAPALSRDFRVLTVDLPGHGKSDAPEVTYDLPRLASGVEAAMRAAGVQRAVVAGHSMGFPVARQLLKQAPDLVLALVSVDGAIVTLGEEGCRKFVAFADTLKGEAGLPARRKFIESMFTEATTPELRASILEATSRTSAHAAWSAMSNAIVTNIWGEPPTSVPVLAIVKSSTSAYGKYFKDPRVEVWSGVSHFLHMEQPDRFNKTLAEFARQVAR